MTEVLSLHFKDVWVFILPEIFVINGLPLLTLKSWESWIEDEMTSNTHKFKNAMRVHMPKLKCSMGVLYIWG